MNGFWLKLSQMWQGKLTIMLVPDSPTSIFTLKIPYWAVWSICILFLGLGTASVFLTSSINKKIVYYNYMRSSSSNFQSQIEKANKYLPNITSSQENIYKQLMGVFSNVGIPKDQETDAMAKELMNGDSTLFLEYLEQKIKNINLYVNNFKSFFRAIPAVLPTNYHFYVSSPFGWRMHPIHKKRYFHSGIDLAIMPGTPILATGDGEVTLAGVNGGYGIVVYVKHNEGYETRYGHMMRVANGIKKGIKVKRGQVVGYVGTTGVSTGYHLHYEVRVNSEPVEPSRFFYLDKFRV